MSTENDHKGVEQELDNVRDCPFMCADGCIYGSIFCGQDYPMICGPFHCVYGMSDCPQKKKG